MEWYRTLSQKDRQVLHIGLLFTLLAGLYVFVYEPLELALSENEMRLALKQSEWSQLQRISQEYKALGDTKYPAKSGSNQSLLAVIDKSSAAAGVKSSIKRLTPEGEHKVRVRIEDVAFDQLIKWLITNSTVHAINAELFVTRKTEKQGRANAMILFAKN